MSNTTPQQVWKTKLTADDTVAQETQGAVRYELDATNGMRGFVYIQAASDTTVADGTPLMWVLSDTARLSVTLDLTDSGLNFPAGVGIGVITASSYGWVQFMGYHDAVITNGDDDIAAGDSIIQSSADGQVDSVAANTAPSSFKNKSLFAAGTIIEFAVTV